MIDQQRRPQRRTGSTQIAEGRCLSLAGSGLVRGLLRRLWAACFVLVIHTGVASAELVEIPLTLDYNFLSRQVATALDMDEHGRTRLRRDACAHADLSDLTVTRDQTRLRVSTAVNANLATPALGACVGPGTWQGRLNVALVPEVAANGLAIRFTPTSAELVGADGTPGLLTRPTRALAEALVLPRLDRIQVDLGDSLASLDELVSALTARQGLRERTRLERLVVRDAGLEAGLVVDVPEAPEAAQAPEPALSEAELAEWERLEDALDGFLTLIIRELAGHVSDHDLRLDLQGALLDARMAIALSLAEDGPSGNDSDPVRRLFLNTWRDLRPLIARLDAQELPFPDAELRLAGFIAAGDAIRALDTLGPAYGIDISRDGLRRLARMLMGERVPESFTPLPLGLDPELQDLFELGRWQEPGAAAQSPLRGLVRWMMPTAHASSDPTAALREFLPTRENLSEYLDRVERLLRDVTTEWLAGNARLGERRDLFPAMVKATAWKESCWRQFVASPDGPRVIQSSVGAIGMMQIHARVWRGIYDVDRLADDVRYNVLAGVEILEHYLMDYAVRRGEHEQPGDPVENLVRATYAAYNGGPGHLSRYRRKNTAQSLRAIDNAFWRDYQSVVNTGRPPLAGCYDAPRG